MSAEAQVRQVKRGDVIFRGGSLDDLCMYEILSGSVGIYSRYGMEDQKQLSSLQAGEFFGEMGLLEMRPRSATAVALEDVSLRMIDSRDLGTLLREDPEKALSIMKHMSSRMRTLSDQYLDACDTIQEYLEAEEAKKPKKEGLLERMRHFAENCRKKR